MTAVTITIFLCGEDSNCFAKGRALQPDDINRKIENYRGKRDACPPLSAEV